MSKGSQTSAEIPSELKALYQNTANNAMSLQNRLWRHGADGTNTPTTPPGKKSKIVESYDDYLPGDTGVAPGSGGGAHGQGAAFTGGGGEDTLPELTPNGGIRRRLGSGTTPSGDDTIPEEVSSQGWLTDMMLGYNPADTAGLSTTQKLARSLLPAMAATPGSENEAFDIARQSMITARELPNDWGSWSRAGRMPSISVASIGGGGDAGGASGGRVRQNLSGSTLAGPGGGAFEPPTSTPSPTSGAAPDASWITDPTIRAAREIFDATGSEQIKNAMSQAGLGRSTATGDALARGWSSQLMPLLESTMGRQERSIERQQAAEEAQLAREQAGIERGLNAQQFAANLGMQRGAADTARYGQTEQAAERVGALEQGVTQNQIDAEQREKLRLQALAEQSLFGPLGGFLPSTIGASTGKSK